MLTLCSMVTLPPSLHASSNVWVPNAETHQSSQCTAAGENCDRSPRLTQLTLTAGNPGVRVRRWGGNPLPVATGSVSVTSALGRIPPGLQGRGRSKLPTGSTWRPPPPLPRSPPARGRPRARPPGSPAPGGRPRAVSFPELPAAPARHPGTPAPRHFFSLS